MKTQWLQETAGARFSRDRQYRYMLWRNWSAKSQRRVLFIGLNPSSANEFQNDPTVRRCIGFAKNWPEPWRCGGLLLMNLYAYRTPNPAELLTMENPRGAANTRWLRKVYNSHPRPLILAMWGNHGDHHGYAKRFMRQMHKSGQSVYCLRQNGTGHPAHPLYLPAGLTPIRLLPAEGEFE